MSNLGNISYLTIKHKKNNFTNVLKHKNSALIETHRSTHPPSPSLSLLADGQTTEFKLLCQTQERGGAVTVRHRLTEVKLTHSALPLEGEASQTETYQTFFFVPCLKKTD